MPVGNDPSEYIIYGDPVAAVIEIIGDAPEIQAFNPVSVTHSLVGYTAGDRWIAITQAGGSFKWLHTYKPRIDFDVFAEDRSTSNDMIHTCMAVLLRAQHNYRGHGMNLIVTQIETAPFMSSEIDTSQVRHTMAFRIHFRPDPSSIDS